MNATDEQIGQFLSQRFGAHQHEESALEVGASYGAICFSLTYLVLTLFPQHLSAFVASQSWWWWWISITVFCLSGVLLGAIFGVVLFALLMRTVARTQRALNSAKLGFLRGFLVGAAIGAGVGYWRVWASNSLGAFDTWALFSDVITRSALWFGSLVAALSAFASVVIANSQQSRLDAESPLQDKQEEWYQELNACYRRALPAHAAEQKPPVQFGIARLLVLTTAIAMLIAIPNMVHRSFRGAIENSQNRLQADYTSDQIEKLYYSYSLGVKVAMTTVSFFLSPYVAWVIIRGPTSFKRMFQALGNWKRMRQMNPLAEEFSLAGTSPELNSG